MDMIYGLIFAMFVLIMLIGWYMDVKVPLTPPRKIIRCQFCDHVIESGYWFRHDWCCFKCWDKYGLEEYVLEIPKRFGSWVRADVKIEEINCNGKL